MISFVPKEEIEKKLLFEARQALNSVEYEYLVSLIDEITESASLDTELAFCITHLTLAVRAFDFGRYSFIYPIELSCRANAYLAVEEIIEYAMREEVAKIFTHVPAELCADFIKQFRHLDIDAMDPSGENFSVQVKSECELLSSVPTLTCDELSVTEMGEAHIADYARLSRDRETNKYWGYDFFCDYGENVTDEAFLLDAKNSFARGVSLSVALCHNGKFMGEGVFYAFDGRGNAEIAIRLLPEACGLGFGKKFLGLLTEYAKMIGLISLSAIVDKRNTSSVALFSKVMEKSETHDTRVNFHKKLY